MCSRCHKRVAVVFVTKIENGQKVSEGICMKCAKELGLPVENMMGNVFEKFGIRNAKINSEFGIRNSELNFINLANAGCIFEEKRI